MEFYAINRKIGKLLVKVDIFPDSCKFLVTSNNLPTDYLCLVKLSSSREAQQMERCKIIILKFNYVFINKKGNISTLVHFDVVFSDSYC